MRFKPDPKKEASSALDLIAPTPTEADRWLEILSSWRHFFAMEEYSGERATGFSPDAPMPEEAPLAFIEAGPRVQKAREEAEREQQRRKEEESANAKEEWKEELSKPMRQRPRRPTALKLVPDPFNGWRPATDDEASIELQLGPASPNTAESAALQAEAGSSDLSSESASTNGGANGSSGGWLSPRRLVEAISFRSGGGLGRKSDRPE